jgi:hypothetical protein
MKGSASATTSTLVCGPWRVNCYPRFFTVTDLSYTPPDPSIDMTLSPLIAVQYRTHIYAYQDLSVVEVALDRRGQLVVNLRVGVANMALRMPAEIARETVEAFYLALLAHLGGAPGDAEASLEDAVHLANVATLLRYARDRARGEGAPVMSPMEECP